MVDWLDYAARGIGSDRGWIKQHLPSSDCETGQLRSVNGDEATRLVLSGINSTLKQLL
jgi:phage baseplate assembly protein gpV